MQEGPGTDLAADYEQLSHTANEPYTTTSAPARAETNDDAYVYEALATDRPRIRLITVWQGVRRASYPYPPTDSDEILCTIKTFEMDKAPSYIALSYTWGEPIPLHTIRLNGSSYPIRENLFDFLKAFGASYIGQQEHYLWIDQLCIDQSNKDERGHQVQMMGDIYRNAEFVISWLDMSCHYAFQCLATGILNSDEIRAHMNTIVCNRYFSRLWIIQEFVLARDVQFMCGNVCIHYRVLSWHVYNLDGRRSSAKWDPSPEWDNAFDLFNTRTHSHGTNLVEILNHGSKPRCEDSRDQVYGLLGIVDSSYHVPEVDYQKPVEQVYLDTVRISLTEIQVRPVRFTIDCALRLGENMCLPRRHMLAIRELLEDICMRAVDGVDLYQPLPSPIIHAIGVDPPESPVEWWYEHQGFRYCFPVQSGADQASQNSPYS